jgi:hypothetical protein
MGLPNVFIQTLAAAVANNISASQSPAAGAILINGSAASGGVATLDTQRRVIITSGGNDSAITFTVFGTNGAGFPIQDTFAGTNAGVAQSNLDFKTVTKVTQSAAIASTITIGTNTVGSSLWQITNWNADPENIGFVVELRSGAATYTVEYTFDDPNILPGTGGLNAAGLAFPLARSLSTVTNQTTTVDAAFATPVLAYRLTTSAGTGTLVFRGLQAGLGSP